MSSHHIVREKQEPALLVLGMDNFSEELLGQLLEWSPTVITTPHTAEKLDSFGIKIDWVITNKEEAVSQSDVKLLPAGDDTMTAAALKYLIANHYPAVNVVTDELQPDDFMLYADKINLVVFYHHQKIYAVNSGFSKWKPAGETIKLLFTPVGLNYTGMEQTGAGEYKTTNDGFFTLQFNQPFVLIAEEVD
ncbi:thiamine pyrophosphokinase [Mucilaginibacter sabulilitoris]|uniref:Thiamine pyrophosphokinase n=1 Tax=Mucilaginibacter sabulilitoris TaxID=1173583 RepID=A0ABZ0TMY8_9SPHI|nr:thiamine pyrophosphokinase [Mucilaginibacter sabulilitoris]WPU94515.1 thiamine pyrophosphokinase [Mucilaginibacter sabulilitoris]